MKTVLIIGASGFIGKALLEFFGLSGYKLILEKKDRTSAGPTAPACGLTLVKIEFPQEIYL